jgi:23S rRNA (adenine2503-C2)-methyltransferase
MNSAPAPVKDKSINLLDYDREGLAAFFVGLGEKPFRATQLMKWVYQEGVTDFDLMTNFSKPFRAWLKSHCVIETSTIATGSSATTNSGLRIIARPITTRCLCPPLT